MAPFFPLRFSLTPGDNKNLFFFSWRLSNLLFNLRSVTAAFRDSKPGFLEGCGKSDE